MPRWNDPFLPNPSADRDGTMHIFYVRASDNGNYGVEEALGNLVVPPERVDVAWFRGTRVPLQPLGFDPTRRGFAGLGAYSLVILAGLDPAALTPGEQLALAAYVERGGALMLIGGTHSFANAQGSYLLLEPILPARILRDPDVAVNAMVRPGSHPIARGLPEPLGYVANVHLVEPRRAAAVALKAGDLPLVTVGHCGRGRVALVASYPDCTESEYGWFFTGDAFDDFLRNAVAWLTARPEPVWVERFSVSPRQVTAGNEVFGKMKLGVAGETEVQLTTQLVGPDGSAVQNAAADLHVKRSEEALFSFRLPDHPRVGGVYYVVANAAAGGETARRDVAIEVANPTRATIEFEHGRRVFLPGATVRVCVHSASDLQRAPAELVVDVALVGADGKPLAAPKRRVVRRSRPKGYEDLELGLPVPHVRPGRVQCVVELRVGDTLADVATAELWVAAPTDASGVFPLVAECGAHMDRSSAERAVAELAAAHVNSLVLPASQGKPWGERPHGQAMVAWTEDLALRAGLAVAHGRQPSPPAWPFPQAATEQAEAPVAGAEHDTARYRLALAGHRGIGGSFGAQVGLDADGIAPAEAAFMAVAHGAGSLRVADNPAFVGERRQPTVAEALGGTFARLSRACPLLALTRRPEARVAAIFPSTQAADGAPAAWLASWQLLEHSLGEVGLADQRRAANGALAPCGAIAIMGNRALPRALASLLVAFVEQGGLLLADLPDAADEQGEPVAWPDGFFGTAETPVFGPVTRRVRRYGKGRTVLFSSGVASVYQAALEDGDAVAARELRHAVHAVVAELGVCPRARSADPAVEIGVRQHGNTWLLVAVNHAHEPRTCRIELDPEAAPLACAFSLCTGEAAAIEPGEPAVLRVDLAPHDGGIWALYPERPFTLRLEPLEAVGPGSIRCRALVLNEAGQPARGAHIVDLTFVDPSGAERPELGRAVVTADGVAEVERAMAASEPAGCWTVTAADRLTRRVVRRTFDLQTAAAGPAPAPKDTQQ